MNKKPWSDPRIRVISVDVSKLTEPELLKKISDALLYESVEENEPKKIQSRLIRVSVTRTNKKFNVTVTDNTPIYKVDNSSWYESALLIPKLDVVIHRHCDTWMYQMDASRANLSYMMGEIGKAIIKDLTFSELKEEIANYVIYDDFCNNKIFEEVYSKALLDEAKALVKLKEKLVQQICNHHRVSEPSLKFLISQINEAYPRIKIEPQEFGKQLAASPYEATFTGVIKTCRDEEQTIPSIVLDDTADKYNMLMDLAYKLKWDFTKNDTWESLEKWALELNGISLDNAIE